MSELIDNRARRIQIMKEIISRLHEGESPEAVKQEFAKLVKETDASEIAAMEQQIIEEGTPPEEIQRMCDLHSQVLRDFTTETTSDKPAPGHPADTFRIENFAIGNGVQKIRSLFAQASETDNAEELRHELLEQVNKLMDIDKHYRRKEELLFPFLEKYGITGPSQVMWAKDDEARGFLKSLLGDLKEMRTISKTALAEIGSGIAAQALGAVEEMIHKEEKILLPMSLQTLSAEEWGHIFVESPKIGWCMVEPREGYTSPRTVTPSKTAAIAQDEAIEFSTGRLTFEQMRSLINTVPFDITFVDADDRVQFFNNKKYNIFSRSTTVLGRKVQHCHPPKSVHIVEQILDDFKSGEQDVAEFWIQLHGKFVHIRYFAVRNDNNEYLGTLEVTQDLTKIRTLEGERRLPHYS